MSNEITVRASLSIRRGNLQHQTRPAGFRADMVGTNGPTPGTIRVAVEPGTDVDLSQLTALGGWAELTNLDATNWVEWGIKDHATGQVYPVGQLLPGELALFRTSPNLQQLEGTGTSTPSGNCSLHCRANGGTVLCKINIFDP